MFIQEETNLAHVVTAKVHTKEFKPGIFRSRTILTFADGSHVTYNFDLTKEITAYGSTVIPAHPGFYVADLIAYDPETAENFPDHYQKSPIIAWRIVAGANPIPITPEGEFDVASYWFGVVYPDGTVWVRDAEQFPSIDAWLERARQIRAPEAPE